MTNASEKQRVRTRCQATTKAGAQCRSTAVSDIDGLCALHGGRLDPVALGKAGAKAKKAKRGKRGSFRDAIRRRLSEDPDHYAAQLLASGAKGLELADKFISEEDAREKAARLDPDVSHLRRPVSFEDMAELFRRTEQIHLLATYPRAVVVPMFEFLTPSELEVVLGAMSGVGAADVGEDSPCRESDAYPAVPADEKRLLEFDEEPPPETDADFLEVLPSPDARRSLGAIGR